MKSNVAIKGHPIHTILVAFPTALLFSAFAGDVIRIFVHHRGMCHLDTYMEGAGIFMGLIAAIPGAIAYFSVLPPESSAKKRGTKHALINILTLVVFGVALCLRRSKPANHELVLLFELAGTILLITAGWMVATLVYRNQIGIYNRYADSGNTIEASPAIRNGKIEATNMDELKTDQVKLLRSGGERIVLGRTENGYVALSPIVARTKVAHWPTG